MTAKTKPMRGRRGVKRLDLTDMRAALADGRQWVALGVVVKPAGGAAHWEIVDGADIMVEVELQPDRLPVFARLAAGMWIVPAIGEEVIVAVPSGELEFQPTVIAVLASLVPETQGPTPTRIVISRGEVVVHDGNGGAVPLAKLSELQALADDFYAHVHLSAAAGSPTSAPVSATPPNDPLTDDGRTGTEILKAK